VFSPILAGATARDRFIGCLAAVLAVALVAVEGALAHGSSWSTPWLVAPIGASAVLMLAVPTSPMAQPWPIVGGSVLSACVGLLVAALLGSGPLACGAAVGLALAAMSLTRSLHPPGGAVALTAVLLGPDAVPEGWWFPLVPLGMNAAVLVAAGWALLRLTGHTYPHTAAPHPPRRDPLPTERTGLREEDVDAVLADVGETFDIDAADLRVLVVELERRMLARARPDLTCATIMSRDLITVEAHTEPSMARALLLESGVRLLPVIDRERRPVGAVGLRELARPAHAVADVMTEPVLTGPERSVTELIGPLTDGHRHAALVVDDTGRLVGLVSQADLLAALARPQMAESADSGH